MSSGSNSCISSSSRQISKYNTIYQRLLRQVISGQRNFFYLGHDSEAYTLFVYWNIRATIELVYWKRLE